MTLKLMAQCQNYSESNMYNIEILISDHILILVHVYKEKCRTLSSDKGKIM